MLICAGYIVLLLSILLYQGVTSNKTMEQFYEDFKDVDSDFDLRKAISNFKNEDFANFTEDVVSKMTDLGPKPVKGPNNTSAEILKLLKIGEALIDTSGEKELQQMRRSIYVKDKESMRLKNMTNIREEPEPEGKKRVKRQGLRSTTTVVVRQVSGGSKNRQFENASHLLNYVQEPVV